MGNSIPLLKTGRRPGQMPVCAGSQHEGLPSPPVLSSPVHKGADFPASAGRAGTGWREAWARYQVDRKGLGGFKSPRTQGKVRCQVTRARQSCWGVRERQPGRRTKERGTSSWGAFLAAQGVFSCGGNQPQGGGGRGMGCACRRNHDGEGQVVCLSTSALPLVSHALPCLRAFVNERPFPRPEMAILVTPHALARPQSQ